MVFLQECPQVPGASSPLVLTWPVCFADFLKSGSAQHGKHFGHALLPYLCMPLHAFAQAHCAWMLVAGSAPWGPRAMMMQTVVNQALSPEPVHGITWSMLGSMLMHMMVGDLS